MTRLVDSELNHMSTVESNGGAGRLSEMPFVDGSIQIYYPGENMSLGVPRDAAQHFLGNGGRFARFDIAYVCHEHDMFASLVNTEIGDEEWRNIREDIGSRLQILAETSGEKLELYLRSLKGVVQKATEFQRLTGAIPDVIGQEYLYYFDPLSEALVAAANPDFNPAILGEPFRGAALVGSHFIRPGTKLVPIKFTRIPLGTEQKRGFGVGISAPRVDFLWAILDDLQMVKGNRLRIVEAGLTTGLTAITMLAVLHDMKLRPSAVELIAPVASRGGIANVFKAAEQLGIDVQILVAKDYPRIGNAWGTGEDSVKDAEGNSIIGDPPVYVGPMQMAARLAKAEVAFAQRHGIDYL